MQYFNKFFSTLGAILFFNLFSCSKLIDVSAPKTQIVTSDVFADNSLLNSAVLNIYSTLYNEANFTPYNQLYVDEISTSSTANTFQDYLKCVLKSDNNSVYSLWKSLYSSIYQSNVLLQGLPGSITDSTLAAIKGECEFLRAYSYFYLTNLFGDVPLLLTGDVSSNATASRSAKSKVIGQMITDLLDAQKLLPDFNNAVEKTRANKWAATALLARIYLYQGDWENAQAESDAIINSGYYSLSPLNDVFLKNSNEAILQIWLLNGYTSDGTNFIPPTSASVPTFVITNSLLQSFEASDQRRYNWIDSNIVNGNYFYYVHKYKNRTTTSGDNAEYLSLFRLGEQYLIRAEAKAQQGTDVTGAINDLNMIRSRAALPSLGYSLNQQEILNAVYQERRVELFTENGHRFFDLKRTGQIDSVMSSQRSTWTSNAQFYPIPKNEIITDPNLSQNAGYN